jgi:hypothetical protein
LLRKDQSGSIELGDSLSNRKTPYIDFHYGIRANEDYNVRLINDADGRLLLSAPTLYTNGNFGIGLTNPQQSLDVNGKVRIRVMDPDPGTGTPVHINSDGDLVKEGTSSKRYKKDIKDLKVNILNILKLRAVSYKWKESGKEDIGLIAEEVAELIPDLVIYDEEGRPDAVKYNKLPIYLLELIKEQQEKIDEQQKQIEELSGEINEIKEYLGMNK